MTEQEYVKAKLGWWGYVRNWLFVIPTIVFAVGIAVAFLWQMELPRWASGTFLVGFLPAVAAHMSVTRRKKELREEYQRYKKLFASDKD